MWHRLKWWFYRIRGKLWARPLLYVSLAIAAVVAAGGADRLFDPEAVPEIDRETLDALMDASHHMGTARMAADPSRGVVDPTAASSAWTTSTWRAARSFRRRTPTRRPTRSWRWRGASPRTSTRHGRVPGVLKSWLRRRTPDVARPSGGFAESRAPGLGGSRARGLARLQVQSICSFRLQSA